MSRKRRMFEIDMPEDSPETFPAGKTPAAETRRGPMATAISETAESSRDRARIEAEIRAENDALAQEHVRLKRAGLVTDMIALDVIDTTKLMRDRAPGPDFELAELVASIRDIGLSNPIRVEPAANGRYELIQGFRRHGVAELPGIRNAFLVVRVVVRAAGENRNGVPVARFHFLPDRLGCLRSLVAGFVVRVAGLDPIQPRVDESADVDVPGNGRAAQRNGFVDQVGVRENRNPARFVQAAVKGSLILEPESTDNFSPARLLEAVFFVFMSLLR